MSIDFGMNAYKDIDAYHFIDQSIKLLIRNISVVTSVGIWAKKMNYSRCYFSSHFKQLTGWAASTVLKEVRLEMIRKEILLHPFYTSEAIAKSVGLRNDNIMYKFLSRHYGTIFSSLRKKILSNPPSNNGELVCRAGTDYIHNELKSKVSGESAKVLEEIFVDITLIKVIIPALKTLLDVGKAIYSKGTKNFTTFAKKQPICSGL